MDKVCYLPRAYIADLLQAKQLDNTTQTIINIQKDTSYSLYTAWYQNTLKTQTIKVE